MFFKRKKLTKYFVAAQVTLKKDDEVFSKGVNAIIHIIPMDEAVLLRTKDTLIKQVTPILGEGVELIDLFISNISEVK